MNDLGSKVADNMLFVAEFAGLVFVIFLIAYLVEKRIHLKNHDTERILSTRKIVRLKLRYLFLESLLIELVHDLVKIELFNFDRSTPLVDDSHIEHKVRFRRPTIEIKWAE